MLSSRLIPVVPFALMGYAAGATRLSLWKFSWTTVVGYLPLTIAVAYLGSRAQTLSLSNPFVWVAVAIPVALLSSEWLPRHRRHRGHPAGSDVGRVEEADNASPEPAAQPPIRSDARGDSRGGR